MHHADAVRLGQAVTGLLDPVEQLIERRPLADPEPLAERLALDELDREPYPISQSARVVELEHAGVDDQRQGLGFLGEAPREGGGEGAFQRHDLEGAQLPAGEAGGVDLGSASGAEVLEDLVAGAQVTWLEEVRGHLGSFRWSWTHRPGGRCIEIVLVSASSVAPSAPT